MFFRIVESLVDVEFKFEENADWVVLFGKLVTDSSVFMSVATRIGAVGVVAMLLSDVLVVDNLVQSSYWY
jgi:hypothetical protein